MGLCEHFDNHSQKVGLTQGTFSIVNRDVHAA
jgi:hypothetical protein